MYLDAFVNTGGTVYLDFNTRKADQTPVTLAGSPVVSVYKDGSATESTSGVSLAVDYDGRVGYHLITINTSADPTFYSSGGSFRAIITAGTVDGVSVAGVRPPGCRFGVTDPVDSANPVPANAVAVNGSTGAAANLAKTTGAVGRLTVGPGATATSIPASAFSWATGDVGQLKNRTLLFDADTPTVALRGQGCTISDSTVSATPTLTVSALTRAPASGDTASIV